MGVLYPPETGWSRSWQNKTMSSLRSGEVRLMAVGHIAYEIETMVQAAIRFYDLNEEDSDGLARNVFLESALLHARNLVEFIATPHDDKYMRPEDFAPGWDYRPWTELKRELGPLNQHLSHLSWKRLDPNAAALSRNLFRRVLDGCEAFRVHLAASPSVGDGTLVDVLKRVQQLATPRLKTATCSNAPALTTSVTESRMSVVEDPLDLRL